MQLIDKGSWKEEVGFLSKPEIHCYMTESHVWKLWQLQLLLEWNLITRTDVENWHPESVIQHTIRSREIARRASVCLQRAFNLTATAWSSVTIPVCVVTYMREELQGWFPELEMYLVVIPVADTASNMPLGVYSELNCSRESEKGPLFDLTWLWKGRSRTCAKKKTVSCLQLTSLRITCVVAGLQGLNFTKTSRDSSLEFCKQASKSSLAHRARIYCSCRTLEDFRRGNFSPWKMVFPFPSLLLVLALSSALFFYF